MTSNAKYDQHYRDDAAACGPPFTEFVDFCRAAKSGSVLDLGCGQGRDALLFARAGHRVLGVDVSSVGVGQLLAAAKAEGLAVEGLVRDLRTYRSRRRFDVVILDRVLHLLAPDARPQVLARAMAAVAPGGHLLVAEGPKGLALVRARVEQRGWTPVKATSNRLIARRPAGASRARRQRPRLR